MSDLGPTVERMDTADEQRRHRQAHFAAVETTLEGMSSADLTALVQRIHDLDAHVPPEPGPPAAPRPLPRELTVRVDLVGTTPPVWRRLRLHSDLRLHDLHEYLQAAFGWTDEYPHGYRSEREARPILGVADAVAGARGRCEDEVTVGELLREPGDRAWYTYGTHVRRGRGWTHVLRLESSAPAGAETPPASCVTGRRAGPLEHLRGAAAHNRVVAGLRADPSGAPLEPLHRTLLPRHYDPARFSVEQVNAVLDYLAHRTCPEGIPEALYPFLVDDDDWLLARIHLLSLQAAALVPDPEDAAHLAHPYRLLLDLAGDDGLPLTPAGWLQPDVVGRLHAELHLDRLGVDPDPRESRVPQVAGLRADAVALGLLRPRSGRLWRTPLARVLRADEDHLALLTGHARKPDVNDAAAAAATCLTALLVADRGDVDVDLGEVTRLLARGRGRRTTLGLPLGTEDVERTTRRVRRVLERARDLDADGAVPPGSAAAAAARRRLTHLAHLIALDPT